MRKYLLAGAAVIGSVGMASAQAPMPAPAPLPMFPVGMPVQPTPYLGGNNSNNSQGAPPAPGPTAPTPGSFVIHLNGRMFMYFALSGSTANSTTFVQTTSTPASGPVTQVIPWNVAHAATLYSNANGIYTGKTANGLVKGDIYNFFHGTGSSAGGLWAVTTPKGAPVTTTTTNKLNPQQFLGYFRMYPGVDAMATNGLRYGAIVEIRQNFIGESQGSGTSASPSAGGPAGNNSANEGASASGNSSGSTLYVRREAAYVGSNTIGIFRFGQDDGPFSQFDNGVTTFQFGDGAWNGDLPAAIPTNAQPQFPFWSGVGKEYAASKGVYLSPQFAGFDFGASYAPSTNANDDAACNTAGSGCAALSSSSTASDEARATNWFELMARYQGTFNGFGIYGIAGYSGSGNVSTSAPITASNIYKPFSVGDAGLVLSYAGFSVGGNILFGQYENQVSLAYKGGKNSVAWLVGAMYTNGPISAGVSYYNFQSQGSNATELLTQRYDDAFAANVTYAVAPGMNAFASFLWGQAHQGGMDLLTGASIASEQAAGYTSGYKSTVSGQAFMLGTQIKW